MEGNIPPELTASINRLLLPEQESDTAQKNFVPKRLLTAKEIANNRIFLARVMCGDYGGAIQ